MSRSTECNTTICHSFQGIPTFLEEGRYKDVSRFAVLGVCGSVKFVPDDLGSPELRLFSASCFSGTRVRRCSKQDQVCKLIKSPRCVKENSGPAIGRREYMRQRCVTHSSTPRCRGM